MALLSVIRRWHLRDKISIREIARRTKLSRNTITKYLVSGETSPRYANRPISVRLYADRVVMAAEGQVIAEHPRRINRTHDGGLTIYNWRHCLSVVQRKPGALRNGAPFADLPEGFRRLQTQLLQRHTLAGVAVRRAGGLHGGGVGAGGQRAIEAARTQPAGSAGWRDTAGTGRCATIPDLADGAGSQRRTL